MNRWICEDEDRNEWSCGVCHAYYILIDGTPSDNHYNFCAECGAELCGEYYPQLEGMTDYEDYENGILF